MKIFQLIFVILKIVLSLFIILYYGQGNDEAFIQYTRALKRLKNRKAALVKETSMIVYKTIENRNKSSKDNS